MGHCEHDVTFRAHSFSEGEFAQECKVRNDADVSDDKVINIFVVVLGGETISVGLRVDDTIDDLKAKIEDEVRIPPDQQSLSLGSKPLTAETFSIGNTLVRGSALHLKLRLEGGMQTERSQFVVDDAPLTSTEIKPEHGLDDGMYEKSRSEADDAQLILRNVDMKIESFKLHKPHGP